MSENLQPQMLVIKSWLSLAQNRLSSVGIKSSKLDAELILAHCLDKNRTYLHSHSDKILDDRTIKQADELILDRLKRVPIAYLLGNKEFYGHKFIINNKTLIPRPESEDLIDVLKNIIKHPSLCNTKRNIRLIDVGTGSGCLGITAKLELPNLDITLSDVSRDALEIARLNAKVKNISAKFILGNLLDNCHQSTDIIIANLPYVDRLWDRSPETDHEPSLALFADDNGMSIIKQLIIQAGSLLSNNGFLLIESDPTQHKEIISSASQNSFKLFDEFNYITAFIKCP